MLNLVNYRKAKRWQILAKMQVEMTPTKDKPWEKQDRRSNKDVEWKKPEERESHRYNSRASMQLESKNTNTGDQTNNLLV